MESFLVHNFFNLLTDFVDFYYQTVVTQNKYCGFPAWALSRFPEGDTFIQTEGVTFLDQLRIKIYTKCYDFRRIFKHVTYALTNPIYPSSYLNGFYKKKKQFQLILKKYFD